jgi:hypothetical protein
MEDLLIQHLLLNNYCEDHMSAQKILESISDSFVELLFEESLGQKYKQEIRTLHQHLSSDPTDPRNRVTLSKYLAKRRRVQKPGGEFYDSSARKSSRPVVSTSRQNLTSKERQKRREEDQNVDTRFSTKSQGKYSTTKDPKKLRKQKALGEFN